MDNPEKPLFQIAIERILDRHCRAAPDDQDEVILTLYAVTKHPREFDHVDRNDAAAKLVKLLFPELKP